MNNILNFLYNMFLQIWSFLYNLSWDVVFANGQRFTVRWGYILVAFSIISMVSSVVWRGAQK